MHTMQLILQNLDQIIGFVIWLTGVLIALGVIRNKAIERYYREAYFYAEQWKKLTGKQTGIVPTNEQVLAKAVEYLDDKLPFLRRIDLGKIAAIVNEINQHRDAGAIVNVGNDMVLTGIGDTHPSTGLLPLIPNDAPVTTPQVALPEIKVHTGKGEVLDTIAESAVNGLAAKIARKGRKFVFPRDLWPW